MTHLTSAFLAAVFALAAAFPAFALDDERLPVSIAENTSEKTAEEVIDETAVDPLPATMAQGTLQGGRGGGARPFLDFKNSEINPFIGAVMFSGEFETDPSFSAGLLFHVPSPALPWRRFGFFVEGLFSSVDRDIPSYYTNRDGNVYLFAGGLDFEFLSSEKVSLKAQAGGLYSMYGDVDGLDDGPGVLLGASIGFIVAQMRQKIMFGYNPQWAFDGDDWMLFHHVGLSISF